MEFEAMLNTVLVPTPGMEPNTILFINPAKLMEYRDGKIGFETLSKYCCLVKGIQPPPAEMHNYLR